MFISNQNYKYFIGYLNEKKMDYQPIHNKAQLKQNITVIMLEVLTTKKFIN